MNAFIKFNKGVMRGPIYVRLWLMLLIFSNLVVPLFYLRRVEAQVVLGAFLTSVILMTALTGLSGFTRLVGLLLVWRATSTPGSSRPARSIRDTVQRRIEETK